MHRYFKTYDLMVALITDISDLYGHSEEGKADRRTALVRLALTCKIFLDPALDLLWKRLDIFEPILDLFPIQSEHGAPVSDLY
jgi:hypothetical protein